MRPLKIGSTKYYEHISETHRCKNCNANKYETNFSVHIGKYGHYYTKGLCNTCANDKNRHREITIPLVDRQKDFLKRWKEIKWK